MSGQSCFFVECFVGISEWFCFRGLCQDVEFPLVQVELQHPIDGPMVYWMPQDLACNLCLKAKDEGFAQIPWDDLCSMIKVPESKMRSWFFQARDNKQTGNVNFGDQETWKSAGQCNDAYIEFEGYSLDSFKAKFDGKDPSQLGLPAITQRHPLTLEMVEIYYVPVPGPLFKLRLSVSDAASWKVNCMPSQIFKIRAI